MFHPPGPRAHDRQLWRRGGGGELVTPGPGNQKAHFHVTRPPPSTSGCPAAVVVILAPCYPGGRALGPPCLREEPWSVGHGCGCVPGSTGVKGEKGTAFAKAPDRRRCAGVRRRVWGAAEDLEGGCRGEGQPLLASAWTVHRQQGLGPQALSQGFESG